MTTITTWFTLGTLGMLVGTAVLAYGFRLIPAAKRRRYAVLVSIPGIAIFAYALMAVEIGGIPVGDSTVWAPKYIDWLLTTPLNVLFLALFAGADREETTALVGLQALTIVFGMAGAVTGGAISWVLFGLGSLTFLGVGYLLYGSITSAARDTHSEVGLGLYETLRNFVVVLWSVYPVIWVLGQTGFGLMDLETTTLVVAYLDVVTKIGFGLLALHGELTLKELPSEGRSEPDAGGEAVPTEPDQQPAD
jgi:sensory rhodopsin